jgi:hypothetical protein
LAPAALAGGAGAAGFRHGHELWHQPHFHRYAQGAVLGVQRGDGPVALVDLLRLHRPSIAATFFATAGAFAGLSLFGYTTRKNLSGMGSFLIMGLFG